MIKETTTQSHKYFIVTVQNGREPYTLKKVNSVSNKFVQFGDDFTSVVAVSYHFSISV